MKKPRFTDSQKMSIPKQTKAEVPVAKLCREHGQSEPDNLSRMPVLSDIAG